MTHVLLIDDENATRLVMASRLREAGHEVTISVTGAQGIALTRERRFDLLLVDAALSSGIGGVEVCRRLRQIPRNLGVPLILVAKSSSREGLAAGYEAGADACLAKSDLPLLEHVMRVFLRKKAEFDEVLAQQRTLAELHRRQQEERQQRPAEGEAGGTNGEAGALWRELAPGKPDGVILVDDDGLVRVADRGAQELFGGGIDGRGLGRLAPASGLEAFVRDASNDKRDGLRFDLPGRAGRAGRSLLAAVVPMVAKPGEPDSGLRVVLLLDVGKRKLATELIRLQDYTLPRREVGVLLDVARVAYGTASLIGTSAALARVRAEVGEAARSAQPVLVVGEAGSGRQHVARALHFSSDGAGQPFLPVACAGLSPEHLEAELFGQVKGAFPDALVDRPGALQQGKGALFLQDVEHLPLALQRKLLRALTEGVVTRAGSERTEPTEMRVIASTQVDLNQAVAAGTFEVELLRALAVNVIPVPPLRERAEDIEPLAQHFVRMFGGGRPGLELAPEALERLKRHAWPGNVLELKSAIDRACRRAPASRIELEHLPATLRDADPASDVEELTPVARPAKPASAAKNSSSHSVLVPAAAPNGAFGQRAGEISADDPISLDHYERKCLERALAATGNDKLKAAKLLKVGKSTLYRKLKRYEIA